MRRRRIPDDELLRAPAALDMLRLLNTLRRVLRRTPLRRVRFVNRGFSRLVRRTHGPGAIQVGPFHVSIDERDQVIAKRCILDGGYERAEIATLLQHVAPGDCALDVGANIGLYTLHLSRAVGTGGCVLAAEPDPDNLELLRRNIEQNQCSNVTLLPFALSNQETTALLFQHDVNRGQLSLADLAHTGKAVSVPIRRAATVLEELGRRPSVMKMDVEGAEPLVYDGLGFSPRVLLFEYVPWQLEAMGQDPEAFLQRLYRDGYTFRRIDPSGGEPIESDPAALTLFARGSASDVNVLALRRES